MTGKLRLQKRIDIDDIFHVKEAQHTVPRERYWAVMVDDIHTWQHH